MKSIPASISNHLQKAEHWLFLTGAGISAESGIPTYRDSSTALYGTASLKNLATPDAFRKNKQNVWDWYEERRHTMRQCQPNAAHYAIAQLQQQVGTVSVVTQNVDGLHQLAGSTNVHELHGNIFRNRCFGCNRPVSESVAPQASIPRCTHCDGYARPDVVWFKERISSHTWVGVKKDIAQCDVLIVVGTSGEVQPAATIPTLAHGKLIIVINPQHTTHDELASWVIRSTAGEAIPELLAIALNRHS